MSQRAFVAQSGVNSRPSGPWIESRFTSDAIRMWLTLLAPGAYGSRGMV